MSPPNNYELNRLFENVTDQDAEVVKSLLASLAHLTQELDDWRENEQHAVQAFKAQEAEVRRLQAALRAIATSPDVAWTRGEMIDIAVAALTTTPGEPTDRGVAAHVWYEDGTGSATGGNIPAAPTPGEPRILQNNEPTPAQEWESFDDEPTLIGTVCEKCGERHSTTSAYITCPGEDADASFATMVKAGLIVQAMDRSTPGEPTDG